MTKEELFKLVRDIFPEASDDQCDYLIWEATGYPSFFSRNEPIKDQMRKQLLEYKEGA